MMTKVALGAAGCLLAALASGEIDRGGITRGVIGDNGQLEVAGVMYDAANATVIPVGCSSRKAGVEPGQVVEVQGTLNASLDAGRADTIAYNAILAGPVQAYGQGQVIVLGQQVLVTTDTVLAAGMQPHDLLPGAIIEISGFHVAGGAAIRATWIGTGPDNACVTGPLTALDSATGHFSMNGLSGTLPAGRTGELQTGSWVRVSGKLIHGELLARKVDILPDPWSAAGDFVVVDGVVAASDAGGFRIGDIVFQVDAATVITGNDSIRAGDAVQVTGEALASGQVLAGEIVIYGSGLGEIPQVEWDYEDGDDDHHEVVPD